MCVSLFVVGQLLSKRAPDHDSVSITIGPNYPAVCTQSIIGDDAIYDLILLEYYVNGAEHGLADLARRLRERFPAAIIIVMKFYGPFDAIRGKALDDEKGVDLITWKKSIKLKDTDLNTLINAIDNDSRGVWRFRKHPNTDKAINKVVREVGGYQFHLPKGDTPRQTLVSYLRFFDKDNHMHLSERGHEYIYDMCKKIVDHHILKSKKGRMNHINKARVGSWGLGDNCNLWKTTGGCTHKHSPSCVLKQYDLKRGKFALEIGANGGWMDVDNLFPDDRTLYVSWLASSKVGQYPNLGLKNGNETFLLDAFAGDNDKFSVGVVRTMAVGVVKGESTARLTLTPRSKKENLFRLVGTVFTNEVVKPIEFGFGPNFNK